MKKFITAFAFLLICTGCQDKEAPDMEKYTTDYSISNNQFGVVVAEDDGVSRSAAKKYAFERAAQIAHSHGFRYFTVDRESQVAILKTEKGDPSQDMPRNMYYELIQSDNFGRDRLESPEMNPSKEISGYQVEFTCQTSKPAGHSYDVCDFGECD